jgi:hypothetical protein
LLAATTLLATLAALPALSGLRGLLTGLLLSAALSALSTRPGEGCVPDCSADLRGGTRAPST